MKKINLIGILALFLIIGYNVLIFIQSPEEILSLTREDSFVENSSAIFYFISAILLFYLFFNSKSDRKIYFLSSGRNYFFLLLAIFFVICLGEEISWGQRIFNIKAPEYILENNRQSEINLHNLNFWEALDKKDKLKHGIVRFYSSAALYAYFWFSFCLLIPLLNRFSVKARNIITSISLPVIPIFTGSLFLFNFIIFEFIERTDTIDMRSSGEIKENNFGLLYLAASISLFIIYRIRRKRVTNTYSGS